MLNIPELGSLWITEKGAVLQVVSVINSFKRCEVTIEFKSTTGRIVVRRISECKNMKLYIPPK